MLRLREGVGGGGGELDDVGVVYIRRRRQQRNERAGIAACGGPWLRLVASVGFFAGVRLVGGRSLRVGGFLLLEPAIKGGLHRCPPLLEEHLLIVSQIGHDPTPCESRPFVVRVHLL